MPKLYSPLVSINLPILYVPIEALVTADFIA